MSHLANRYSSGTYTHTLYSVSTMGPGVPSHIQMNAPGTSNSCSKATKTWIPYGKEYWNGWSRKLKLCLGRSTCHLKGCFRISMVMFCFDHYASVPYFDFFFFLQGISILHPTPCKTFFSACGIDERLSTHTSRMKFKGLSRERSMAVLNGP
jgi:hypothetical protein